MRSKTKEYQKVFDDFTEQAFSPAVSSAIELSNLAQQECDLNETLQNNDYKDQDCVLGAMEAHIYMDGVNRPIAIKQEVREQVREVSGNKKIQLNFKSASDLIGLKKANELLHQKPVDCAQGIDIQKAEDAGSFPALGKTNDILGKVFRFSFLKSFPKALQVLAGIVVWGTLFSALNLIPLGIVAICANVAISILANQGSCRYIKENQLTLLALFSPEEASEDYAEYRIKEFRDKVVSVWEAELENIKQNGLDAADSDNPDSMYRRVYDDFKENYERAERALTEVKSSAAEQQKSFKSLYDACQNAVEELQGKENDIKSLVREENLNDGVLTPVIPFGFRCGSFMGAKCLFMVEHNCKPVFITYPEEFCKNIEAFKSRISDAVERIMLGFLRENSFNNVEITLVDFIGMHFPEERTKGAMEVITRKQDLQKLYERLQNAREAVNGKIAEVNPQRLANRENAFPYHVVIFAGNDFVSIDNEVSQLFVSGSDFGFIPFVFISDEDVESIGDGRGPKGTLPGILSVADDDGRMCPIEVFRVLLHENYSAFVQLADDAKAIGDGTGYLLSDRVESLKEKINVSLGSSESFFLEAFVDDEGDADFVTPLYVDVAGISEDLLSSLIDGRHDAEMRLGSKIDSFMQFVALEEDDISQGISEKTTRV